MIDDLISIIVPVYNVEQYISKCLDSILSQTYKNIEIIIINDGSTDTSGAICDAYAQRDMRIKVIHQENQGLSAARNVGLTQAQGMYVGFVDSDDWISPEMYYRLHSEATFNHADIAACGMYKVVNNDVYISNKRGTGEIKQFTKKRAIANLLSERSITCMMCDKLYKRSILPTSLFPEGCVHEDNYVIVDILERCEKIIYVDTPYYYYYQRNGSICNSFVLKHLNDRFNSYLLMNQRVKECYPDFDNLACRSQIVSNIVLYGLLINKTKIDPGIKELSQLVKRDMDKYSIKYVFRIPLKRRLSFLVLKLYPGGLKFYNALESCAIKFFITKNTNLFNYRKIL